MVFLSFLTYKNKTTTKTKDTTAMAPITRLTALSGKVMFGEFEEGVGVLWGIVNVWVWLQLLWEY
jgi:hypothetical protein